MSLRLNGRDAQSPYQLRERERKRRFDRTRPNSHKRGYTRKWRALSKRRLAEYPICEAPHCSNPSKETDHIVPRAQGGADEWDNCQALCKSCHSRKTALEDSTFAERKRKGAKGNGMPRDPKHPWNRVGG